MNISIEQRKLVEQVDNNRYLWSVINKIGNYKEETNSRIKKSQVNILNDGLQNNIFI